MKFSDIVGHSEIIESLQEIADSGKIPHAILFSGVRGVGKFRVARAFAQYLHCKDKKNGDSCGKCPSCIQHQNHNNPDLHFIYPVVKKDGVLISKDVIEQWREMLDSYSYMPPDKWNDIIKAGNSQPAIYVSESEEIINRASLSAFQENLKIFIIWLPEKMRIETANKLLKIIEEPFEDTVFIFVSNDESKILTTLHSRTQKFNFKPLSKTDIEKMLVNRGVSSETAADAARVAGGSIEKAEEIACHPEELIEFSDLFKDIMRSAYSLNARRLKELSEDIAVYGREKILRFLSYCGRMIRENYIYNLGIRELNEMTKEESNFSVKFAPFIHEGNVESLQSEIARASTDIERNANSKIVLFDLFLLLSRSVRKPRTTSFPFYD